jgi:DNA-binding CsgD family transcriptional regulator
MKDLSPRQREILALVAAGRTSKDIAGELGISESTVNWHLSNVFERLGASSRAEAVAIAMREGSEGDAGTADRPRQGPWSVPLSGVALAFVLTLLLGLIGGAVIAEWDRTTPRTPLAPASAAPSSGVSQTARPTGRPLLSGPDPEAAPTAAAPTAPDSWPTAAPEPGSVPRLPTLPVVLRTASPTVAPNELPIVGPLPAQPIPMLLAAPSLGAGLSTVP